MYRLEIYFKNNIVMALTLNYDELITFLDTIVESGCTFDLVRNKKSMYFDTVEDLRLFMKGE